MKKNLFSKKHTRTNYLSATPNNAIVWKGVSAPNLTMNNLYKILQNFKPDKLVIK